MNDKNINTVMLEALLMKKSWVLQTQDRTRKDLSPAIAEVDRQIKEILQGKKATKSGRED